MRGRLLHVLLAAGVLAGGCSSDDVDAGAGATTTVATTTTTEPVPVHGLVGTLGTNRLYVTRHAFGLGIRNVSDEPVAVRSVLLDSPLYEPAAAGEQGALLQAGGRRFVLPIPYGAPRCDDPAKTFAVTVTLDDGTELRVPVVEEYPGAILRLHERECFTVGVHERADLRFGDDWTRDGITISGELLLDQRHAGEPVAVHDVRGNVIFTFVTEGGGGDEPILEVTDDEPSARVPVTISADRCDPHAVAEFKRPYVVLTFVSVGEGEPVPVELEATGAAKDAFAALIASCSTG